MKKLLVCLMAILAFLVIAGGVNATDIYNNIGVPTDGTDNLQIGDCGPCFDSFSTGSEPFMIESVQLLLQYGEPSYGTIDVSLRSDCNAEIDYLLYSMGTVNNSALDPNQLSIVTLSFEPYLLAAKTRYWVEVHAPNCNAGWAYSDTLEGTVGLAGEFFSTML